MTTFTPGPWGVHPFYYEDDGILLVGPGPFETVAEVRHGCEETEGGDAAATLKANAHLIALSPELYEYVESSAQNGCATAQALIAKARGEA